MHRECSSDKIPMQYEEFSYDLARMFALCGLALSDTRAKIFFEEFQAESRKYLKAAFNRITKSPPNRITAELIWATIRDVSPKKPVEYIEGCEYCETGATIPYVKVINGRPYQYVARCHMCQKSKLKHLPFYNEEMPHDRLQPKPKADIKDDREEIRLLVQNITMQEAEDKGKEMYRQRILKGQREYIRDNSIEII